MKSQVQLANRVAGSVPAGGLHLAMGLAVAVLLAAPLRSEAHGEHAVAHAHAAVWHGGSGHAVRADFHGGVGVHGGVGFHGVGPVGHVGWHGGPDGRWEHGWHGGHYGWWYVNAGVWTVYPYYPYGYPYGYPYYYGYPGPYPYVYAPPEPAAYNGNLPPQQQTWYWCENPRGYYPSVQTCPAGWRPVTPQASAQPMAPPPAAPPAGPQ